MARKKTSKGGGGKKPNRTPAYTIYVRVPPQMGEALEAFISAQHLPTTLTGVVQAALARYLEEGGHWPPKPKQDAPQTPSDS